MTQPKCTDCDGQSLVNHSLCGDCHEKKHGQRWSINPTMTVEIPEVCIGLIKRLLDKEDK